MSQEYFGSRAASYDEPRKKGLLGWLVARECEAVFRQLRPSRGETVLDGGCGAGFYSEKLREMGAIPYGVDASAAMIEVYQSRGFDGCVMSLETMELNRKFDFVLCAGALEFIPHAEAAFRRLANHLATRGTMVCIMPRRNLVGFLYQIYHRLHRNSIRLFSRKEIEQLAESNQLKIRDLHKPEPLTWVVALGRAADASG